MAKYQDIEEFRRKKRHKSFIKKLLLFICVIVLMVIVLSALKIFKGVEFGNPSQKDQGKEFPLVLKNQQMVSMEALNKNIALLTKSNVLVFDSNGKKINTIIHGYTNPVLKENNKRILTYDRGGMKLRVDTATAVVGEIEIKNNILSAQISSNGNVAIITSHDKYACEIIVYDRSLKNQIYRYYATQELSAIEFSKDEQYLLSTAITTQNGIISTNLYRLNISDDKDFETLFFKDILPIAISPGENKMVKIVGKDCVISYDMKTKNELRYAYKGDIQHFENTSNGDIILVNKNPFNSYSVITVISNGGKEKSKFDINDEVIDVYSDSKRIVVLSKTSAYNFDMNLKSISNIKLKKSMNKVVIDNSNIYILGADTIEKYRAD